MTQGMLVVGRNERMGLGSMTEDFCRAFSPEWLAIIDRGRPAIFDPSKMADKGGVFTDQAFAQWKIPEGVETIVGFETFYDNGFLQQASRRGLKIVLFPMWEWTPPPQAEIASKLVVLSETDKKSYRDYSAKTVVMQWPAMHGRAEACDGSSPSDWLLNWPPKNFVHVAGNARHNRDGTKQVLEAAAHLKGTDAKLIVYSAFGADHVQAWPYDPDAPIEFRSPSETRRGMYEHADVLVQPRRLGGHSLPMNEAAGEGIPIICLGTPDSAAYAGFKLPYLDDGIEKFGRVNAPMIKCNTDELGLLMKNLALGLLRKAVMCSIPSWQSFVEEWQRVV